MQKKSLFIKRASAVMAAAVLAASAMPAGVFAEEAPAAETEISLDEAVTELEQAADEIIAELNETVDGAAAEISEAADAAVDQAAASVEEAAPAVSEIEDAVTNITQDVVDKIFEGRGFTDVLREKLADCSAEISKTYDYYIESIDKSKNGVKATYRITLDDGARALVSMFASLDISWFDALTINEVQKYDDGKMYVEMSAVINETQIANVYVIMDLKNRHFYVSIPEVNEGYISMGFDQMTQLAGSTAGAEVPVDSDTMSVLVNTLFDFLYKLMEDPASVLPDPAVVSGAFEKVANIALDNIINVDSTPDTFSFGTEEQITLDYTMHEAVFGPEEMVEAGKQLIAAAMEDENIQGLLAYVSSFIPASVIENDGKDLATSVNEMLPQLAAQLEQVDTSEGIMAGNYVDLRLWETAEGKIQGLEATVYSNNEADGTFTALLPDNGDKAAAYVAFQFEGQTIELNGNGSYGEDGYTGFYTLSFSGLDLLGINVLGCSYDPETYTGSGSVEIYPMDGLATMMGIDTSDESDSSNFVAGMLLGLDIVCDYSITADGINTTDLHVSMSGSPLFSINCEAEFTDGPAVPAIESLAPIYDVSNPEDGEKYGATASFDTILQNLTAAGAGDLINMIMGGGPAAVEEAPVEGAPAAEAEATPAA